MPLIVGSESDPHVNAVTARMQAAPMLLDAASLATAAVTLTGDHITIAGREVDPGRGWLRRLAPEGWAEAMNAPGVTGAERSATMSALAAIARDERFTWLTPLDLLGAAENKPLQYRRAAAAGVPVPEWMVTTDPAALPVDGAWVSKPLGPGSFIDDNGQGWIVPTAPVDLSSDRDTLVRIPFVLQRRLTATAHARVVTVGSVVHSATLPADDLPLDWRLSPEGHHGFTAAPAPDPVHSLAVATARCLGVGYSAQDWIRDDDGLWWFIDLNPAGQWLFLPTEVSDPITTAIAEFLDAELMNVVA
jgi:hypothetical protein